MAFIVGGYILVNRRTLEAAEVARSRLRVADGPEKTWSLLKDDRISEVPFVNRLLSGKAWVSALGVQLERAGSVLRPGTFVGVMIMSGVIGTVLGAAVRGVGGFFFTVLGWAMPFIWLKWSQ